VWWSWPRWLMSRILESSPLEFRVRQAELDGCEDAVAFFEASLPWINNPSCHRV
jgi:hypothetical protein